MRPCAQASGSRLPSGPHREGPAVLGESGTSWLRHGGGSTHHICPGALAVAWAQTRAAPVCRGGAAVGGTRWCGCCRFGPLRPPGAGGPSTQNCLSAPAPDAGRAQALVRLPPLRCRRDPSATPPPPVQLGGRCAATPARQPRVAALGLNPRSRQVQESAVRGPLLLLDAPPSLLGAQFRRGVPEEGLSPPTAHAAPVPRHAPDPGRLSDGSAAA